MEPDSGPENGDRSPAEETESAGEPASNQPRQSNQGNPRMTKQRPSEELKDSFDRNQLIQRNIEMALDVVLRTNPAENILKDIDDDDLREQSRDQVQSMMNEWLDMYRDMLEEGRPLGRDLIGRSAELAEERRKQEPRVSSESRSGRR